VNTQLFNLFLALGGIFSALAALMAYLITYNEYIHHYQSKEQPRKIALQTALLAFIFFFALTMGVGFFLTDHFRLQIP
jgi:hypothetical protein